jgi:hypothetical protein
MMAQVWAVVSDPAWFGALAQGIAAIIAAVAILIAVRVPRREQLQSRTDSTHEVLRATYSALQLFRRAVDANVGGPEALAPHAAQAAMLRSTLETLGQRPALTDGAVITAAGAKALMNAIVDENRTNAETVRSTPNGFARRSSSSLPHAAHVEALTAIRAKMVIDYARRKRWPDWKRRFRDEPWVQQLHAAGLKFEQQSGGQGWKADGI